MAVKDQVHSNQFTRPVTIQYISAYTDDGQGGQVPTWTTLYSCFADIQDFAHARGLKRMFFAQQNYPQTNTIVVIRWQNQYHIDGTMRVQHVRNGVTHNLKILDAGVFNESNVSIYLNCQEDQAKGVN
jgi:SPP1 family predicted phage head-tail adaptor